MRSGGWSSGLSLARLGLFSGSSSWPSANLLSASIRRGSAPPSDVSPVRGSPSTSRGWKICSGALVETKRPAWSRGRSACGISCANASRAPSKPPPSSAIALPSAGFAIVGQQQAEFGGDEVERPQARGVFGLQRAIVRLIHEQAEPSLPELQVDVAERLVIEQGLGGVRKLAPLA